MSFGQSGGIPGWQSGFFEAGFSSGNVVGHAAVDEALLLEVVEHITGAGVFIAGLADATDIHAVALRGVELGGNISRLIATAGEGLGVFLPDCGDVGMAVEADECGLGGEVGFGLYLVVDVVEAGGFVERGVGEGDGIEVC